MTVMTRKRIQTISRPKRRTTREFSSASRIQVIRVRLVRPRNRRAAIQRGQRLADVVRQELALDQESLDKTMAQLRGRAWS
jgi:hypothetical protein